MLLSAFQIVSEKEIEDLVHSVHVLRHYTDQSSRLRIHGGQPHHLRVVLTKTFASLNCKLVLPDFLEELILFKLIIGKVHLVVLLWRILQLNHLSVVIENFKHILLVFE